MTNALPVIAETINKFTKTDDKKITKAVMTFIKNKKIPYNKEDGVVEVFNKFNLIINKSDLDYLNDFLDNKYTNTVFDKLSFIYYVAYTISSIVEERKLFVTIPLKVGMFSAFRSSIIDRYVA